MPTSRELCPHCGYVHERPFSDRALQLYHQVQATKDEGERTQLLAQLANVYAEDFDSTNEEFDDKIHHEVDDFVAARLEFEQAAMQLGRTLLRAMNSYMRGERSRTQKRKQASKAN
jgi:hypothetical protein